MSMFHNRIDRARAYFSQPGFNRLLEEIWKRHAGLEKTGGHAVVRHASKEECEAINSFMGWSEKPGTTIRVPLLQFEHELLMSAFECSITELHLMLVGEPLLTKSERKLVAEEAWLRFFESVEKVVRENSEMASAVQSWLDELRTGSTIAGFRMIRDLWGISDRLAETELANAARAWNILLQANKQGQPAMRLPVIAARAAGNPHALDRNMSAGRLLLQGFRFNQWKRTNQQIAATGTTLEEESSALDSLKVRDIYRAEGILDDDVSSLVHLYRPHYGQDNEPYVMTLRQVEAERDLPAVADIYVVENPAVFSTLIDHTAAAFTASGSIAEASLWTNNHLLMCTSGPASAAALRLMDRYIQQSRWSGKLYYSGDYDVKGIEIGNVLANRYPQLFVPWRFNAESYLSEVTSSGFHGVPFKEDELTRMGNSEALWDEKLFSVLLQYGYKLFQEQFIALLNEDWERAVR